jgi:hypothetical protein
MGPEDKLVLDIEQALQTPSSWGVSIEGTSVSIAGKSASVAKGTADADGLRFIALDSVLPSLLLPRLPRERTRLQSAKPLHPRGENDIWPPDSRLNDGDDGPRVPVALLWRGIGGQQSRFWKWKSSDGAAVSKNPAFLLAQTICETLQFGTAKLSDQVVAVVPNSLVMSSQQLLLDECYQAGLNVRLLWRPVAAALSWCQQYAETIEIPEPSLHGNTSGGQLLSLHLGLDEIEVTVLELVHRASNAPNSLLPARRRPIREKERIASFGMNYLLECARRFVKNPTAPANAIWQRLCGSDRVRKFLSEARENPDAILSQMLRSRSGVSKDGVPAGIPWYPQPPLGACFEDWLSSQRLDTSRISGVVITGELAPLLVKETLPLWKHSLHLLGCTSIPKRLTLDDFTLGGHGILARGACIHGERLLAGVPSYLDTLPRIQTALSENGEPRWFDLLSANDDYVDGGRLWKRPEPLGGMHISKDQSQLELVLSHEEFSTVRKVSVNFREPAASNIPVVLEVSIQPAQGNAKVEVVPQITDSTFHRLPIEWKSMRDAELTADAWIKSQPTAFPPLMPRGPSDTNWQSAKKLICIYLGITKDTSLFGQSQPVTLQEIAAALSKKDQNPVAKPNEEATSTAFSSEGTLSRQDDGIVELFIKRAAKQLSSGTSIERAIKDEVVVRALGYTSTADAEFHRYLDMRIRKVSSKLQAAELIACGRCLRSPETIARFASAALQRFLESTEGVNNWLKALGEILRYRYDATKAIDSGTCLGLVDRILIVFERELNDGRFNQIFRNSCICIVCLLRRRMFDADFLDLGTPAQIKAHEAFTKAIDVIRRRRRASGGTINIATALQDMLDCIDKRGPSLLQASNSMRAMVDDD